MTNTTRMVGNRKLQHYSKRIVEGFDVGMESPCQKKKLDIFTPRSFWILMKSLPTYMWKLESPRNMIHRLHWTNTKQTRQSSSIEQTLHFFPFCFAANVESMMAN